MKVYQHSLQRVAERWRGFKKGKIEHYIIIELPQCQAMPGNAGECQGMPGNARECQAMPGNARECQAMSGGFLHIREII